jgi:hypothetical protein
LPLGPFSPTETAGRGPSERFVIGTNARATITDGIATRYIAAGLNVIGSGRLFMERDMLG